MPTMPLKEVDKVEILSILDNTIDLLLPNSNNVKRLPRSSDAGSGRRDAALWSLDILSWSTSQSCESRQGRCGASTLTQRRKDAKAPTQRTQRNVDPLLSLRKMVHDAIAAGLRATFTKHQS